MRLMCERDGGITIYEKVNISRIEHANLFDDNGELSIPLEIIAKPTHAYYTQNKSEQQIRERNPKVWKDEYWYVRRSDKKLIAKNVLYVRRGGDFPFGIAHDSSFICPSNQQFRQSLQSLFLIKE